MPTYATCGEPGVDLTITQTATAMTVQYRAGGQPPAPVKLTYALDGSTTKNTMAGRGGGAPTEQVSKAMWAANRLVVTTTTRCSQCKREHVNHYYCSHRCLRETS